jgi:hypothetical protein
VPPFVRQSPFVVRDVAVGDAASTEASDRPCWAAYGPIEPVSKTISALLYGRSSPIVTSLAIIGHAAKMVLSLAHSQQQCSWPRIANP